MSTRTWTVDVDGVPHTIVVDYEPKSRRAAVRVDGRLTSKPMAADESERDVDVAGVHYVVRRLPKDDFSLDISPEVFTNRMTSKRKPAPASRRGGIGIWIGGVVVLLIVSALVRFGMQGLRYMRIDWQPYASADGVFKTKFPKAPAEAQQTQNINGDLWTFHSLQSEYRNHFYLVEYTDLKLVVVEANAQAWMERFLQGMAAMSGASIVKKEASARTRNPALNFELAVPRGAGAGEKKLPVAASVRGFMTIRGSRMYVVTTVAATADPFSKDLSEFLNAFQITPPPPPATFEAIERQQSKSDQTVVAPVKTLADVDKQARDEEAEAARKAAEIAARRAAQPQIYLEAGMNMYHVAGCSALTPDMQKVAIEQRPMSYAPHLCVPEDVRTWRRTRS